MLGGWSILDAMRMETFGENAEQGIVEFLEYVCRQSSVVPDALQNLAGQQLQGMLGISC
jgi:hypothetical protein